MSDETSDTPPAPVPSSPASGPADEMDFGKMLEASSTARSFEEGETVEGVVIAIWPDVAFLDVGGKSEAMIDIEELRDAEGDLEVEVGDRIQAIVVAGEGGLKLSRKLAQGAVVKERLAEAHRAGLPVEGRVEKAIKGGYDVRVAGTRAFCPISQIDTARTLDPATHEGRVYTFRIVEYKEGGKNLVVSRRALLEEEEREKAQEVRKAVVPGAVLSGRVVSVREYGAFVDLGAGVQGLLHVSEMGWARVSDPGEIVKPGDEIQVKVLRIDSEKGKISLGVKQLQTDPWSTVADRIHLGQVLPGRVTRLQDFGAFVELEPGIEGLAHVSTFAPTGMQDGWKGTVLPGTTCAVEVLSIDLERKRIGVAILEREAHAASVEVADQADGGAAATIPTAPARPARIEVVPGARLKGKVERHEKFGVFVFLTPGKTGLIPFDETGLARGADLKKAFPRGSEVDVVVLEVDPSGRRIRLSRKAVLDGEERSDAREFSARQEQGATESFGSLADKLRSALGPKPGPR